MEWTRFRRALPALLVSLIVFLAAACPYLWVLDLPLTGIDAIPTVAAARTHSPADIPRLLTGELRGGADSGGSYYRPLTMATYAVDFALWGWNPRGYHLTDLFLHGLAAVSVFWMARLAFGRGRLWALLATAIFILHPATIEVVPAVSRRQEPLLVLGLSLALIGARGLPGRGSRWLVAFGSLVAVLSVERGLIVPFIVFTYLLLQPDARGSLRMALRGAARGAAPALGVAAAFYLLHLLLFSASDIHFVGRRALSIPLPFLMSLIYPQQIIDLSVPRNHLEAIGWAVLAPGLGLWLVGALRRSPALGIILFAAVSTLGYCALFAVAGQSHPWYAYTAVPGLGLAASALLEQGTGALRTARGNLQRGAPALGAATLLVVTCTLPSPLLHDYAGWRTASALLRNFLAELSRVSASVPAGTGLVVFNLPAHYEESNAEYLVTRSAAILWPNSVRAWSGVAGVSRPIVCVGASDFVGAVSTPAVVFADNGRVSVSFPGGPSTVADPDHDRLFDVPGGCTFAWPPPVLQGRHFESFVFDGTRLERLQVAGGE